MTFPRGHNIVADVASLVAIVAAFDQLLPSIATIVSIAYFGVLLYDRFRGK